MLTTRWQPFGSQGLWSEMNRLRDEMDRVFGRYGVGNGPGQRTPVTPAFNLWRDEDNLYCEAELPGLNLDDLEIYASGGNQLTVKGKREAPSLDEATWHRRERGQGGFARVIALPEEIDADKVEAEFRHGVLCVKLPKSEAAKPRRIEVKTG